MKKKINIISTFNSTNIFNLLKSKLKDYEIKNYPNSTILEELNNDKKNNYINILFFDTKLINKDFLNILSNYIDNNNTINILIPYSLERNNIYFPIIKKKYKNEIECLNKIYKLSDKKNLYIINIEHIITQFNNIAYNYKRWFSSKIPFTILFENFLSTQLSDLINVLNANRKKAIFIDLDDTIWGGTLAEVGYKNLKIGGMDPVGESFQKFQRTIKAFKNSGIILGIISRNFEKTALEAIKKHPEMILEISDFSGWKINHKKKSQNIIDLCKELNISTDSVIFLDNNEFERNEVRSKYPEIEVPEIIDYDPSNYFKVLENTKSLSYIHLSNEDKIRSENYTKIRLLNKKKSKFLNHKDWLKSLKMTLDIEKYSKNNLERIFQMYNKINQLNLSSRRLSKKDIENEVKNTNLKIITFRLKDNITDYGIISLMSYKIKNNKIQILDFLFSCRALGRNIERYIFKLFFDKILKKNYKLIYINFRKTNKNKLLEELLNNLQIEKNGNEYSTNKPIKDTFDEETLYKVNGKENLI
jgi:FkbH-like protein